MRKHTRRVLATSHIAGQLDLLDRLVETASELDVDSVMIVGDLVGTGGVHRADAYREVFGKLGALRVPTFFVPGAHDAPLDDYRLCNLFSVNFRGVGHDAGVTG